MMVMVKSLTSRDILSNSFALPDANTALIFSSTARWTMSSCIWVVSAGVCSGSGSCWFCRSSSGSSSTRRISAPDNFEYRLVNMLAKSLAGTPSAEITRTCRVLSMAASSSCMIVSFISAICSRVAMIVILVTNKSASMSG